MPKKFTIRFHYVHSQSHLAVSHTVKGENHETLKADHSFKIIFFIVIGQYNNVLKKS